MRGSSAAQASVSPPPWDPHGAHAVRVDVRQAHDDAGQRRRVQEHAAEVELIRIGVVQAADDEAVLCGAAVGGQVLRGAALAAAVQRRDAEARKHIPELARPVPRAAGVAVELQDRGDLARNACGL